ncbi:hypothetical protein FRX31_004511 [Thalictrum thalictroides]|uniref:Uncharacterized protein n=1 Tax=Thalictrum thalictroides TaxID=46969 RepID=A0A7J6X8E3_THATH|nr:hypothetical protein FRX31_004511 [Thalictrum thalictroides]
MGDLPLPKRHLRFHYSGKFREIGNSPSKLHLYFGGASVDSKDWDGDEVFMGDLVKEVDKLVGIPEDHVVELRWFWLSPKDGVVNQLVHIIRDDDVVFMFGNAKAHVVELSDGKGSYGDEVEVLNKNIIDMNFSSLNDQGILGSKQGILGEDELHDDYSLNEKQVDIDVEDDGNLCNVLFDDELSENYSDYVASEDISVGVNKKKKFEYKTRSKEALKDIDRIDDESDYDSPDS